MPRRVWVERGGKAEKLTKRAMYRELNKQDVFTTLIQEVA